MMNLNTPGMRMSAPMWIEAHALSGLKTHMKSTTSMVAITASPKVPAQ